MRNLSHRNIRIGLGLVVIGALAAPAAHAQVYKCVGAGGATVYSQSRCPSGAKSSVISQEPRPAEAPASKTTKPTANSPAYQDMEYRKRQQDREAAEKKAG